MFDALYGSIGQICQVIERTIYIISFKYCNDFVVCFIFIQQPQSTNGNGINNNITLGITRSVSTRISSGSPSPLICSKPEAAIQRLANWSPQ